MNTKKPWSTILWAKFKIFKKTKRGYPFKKYQKSKKQAEMVILSPKWSTKVPKDRKHDNEYEKDKLPHLTLIKE